MGSRGEAALGWGGDGGSAAAAGVWQSMLAFEIPGPTETLGILNPKYLAFWVPLVCRALKARSFHYGIGPVFPHFVVLTPLRGVLWPLPSL